MRSRTVGMVATLALVVALGSACSGDDGGDTSGEEPTMGTGGEAPPRSGFTITVDRGDGETEQWTLECDPPGGTHPDPAAACAAIAANTDVLEPLPFDVICTEIYGGPQTARIEGVWEGERVVVELSRTNGCEIDRWDRWQPVVVETGGVES